MNKNLIMLLCILALWLLVIKPLNKNKPTKQNSTTTTPKVEEYVDDPSTYPDYDNDATITVASTTKENNTTVLNAGRTYTV